jgi:hypothetical protein
MLVAASVNPALCLLGLLQIVGIASAGIARAAEGTRHERLGQALCVVGLAVIGALCGVSVRIGPDATASCAVTLAVMTMIAVVDVPTRR